VSPLSAGAGKGMTQAQGEWRASAFAKASADTRPTDYHTWSLGVEEPPLIGGTQVRGPALQGSGGLEFPEKGKELSVELVALEVLVLDVLAT
jgi:hypothetical protein